MAALGWMPSLNINKIFVTVGDGRFIRQESGLI